MRVPGWAIAAAWCVQVAVAPTAWALNAGAASPDGKLFVTGGDGRALYVYDTGTWEIAKRLWLGARVQTLAFTPDGGQCIVGMDQGLTWILDTGKWEKTRELQRLDNLAVARTAPVAVSTVNKWSGGKANGVVRVWSTADWSTTKEIPLGEGLGPDMAAIAADGKTAFVRTSRIDAPDEAKADPGPEPKDSAEKNLWRERKDGKATSLLLVDLAQGTVAKTVVCFDTTGMCRLYPVPSGVMVVSYNQYHALWSLADNSYTPTITKQFAYGSGQSVSGEVYMGALRSYLVLSPEGKEVVKKEAGKLPGFPEYFRCFAPLGEGLVVGVTDANRLIVIDAKTHEVVKEVNCY